jgi:homoserine kinase
MPTIKNNIHSITAFAPATCANVAVGFDILGFAFEEVGDYVTLTLREDNMISITTITSAESLPLDVDKNTASFVIQRICEDLALKVGFSIQIQKGIPVSSGMGGSAASAVAALVAFNGFLDEPLSQAELVRYALFGEELASGQAHPDNIVPCIYGGLTLIHSTVPLEVINLPVPNIFCVLIHPHLQVSTNDARKILQDKVSLKDHIKQSANLAAFIAALYEKNLELMKKVLTDILIEPQRAQFVPGFYKAKIAALKAGALGASFSGSGPSMFAFAKEKNVALTIAEAMQTELKIENINSDLWISRIGHEAAHITQIR